VDTEQEFLKVPEVAKILRIARSRAYELCANGTIPAIKIGRSLRVSRKALERYLERQTY
jgi:excisionase family DNA binding protein